MNKWHEALEIIFSNLQPIEAAKMPIDDALSLVASEDALSPENLPAFDNSAMDGFAVRFSDCAGATEDSPVSLRVLEDLPAGRVAAQAVSAGAALRIMTGAVIPMGCDVVVPVEDTRPATDADEYVYILRTPKLKGNIRAAGEDIVAGQTVISEGQQVSAAHIGLMAALGISELLVIPPVKAAVITTGSELADVLEKPVAGKIRDANIHSLSAQIRSWGAVPIAFPRIADTRQAVESALEEAASLCDLLITTGGVSVGDYDYVKEVLNALGAKQHFWRVAQKPGGPFGFWTLWGKPFFGIPGNPVSAIVMAELYLKPAIYRMMGRKNVNYQRVAARLESGFRKTGADGKRHFLRVIADEREGKWTARLSGPQGSAQLASMRAANALAMIPEDTLEVPAGGEVELLLIKTNRASTYQWPNSPP
ncbi:MAG: molybdopterin molybdotransferase MoeA [Holophagales bacterium]|nr:molybdopterin molybdotransferase MoeA [Holophagales bacterium]